MKVIKVIPIYGFGWAKAGQAIDVPSPFKVGREVCEKVDDGNVYRLIIGSVSEPGHMFDGLWVLIAVRTRGAEPTYNIFIYSEKPPFYRGENVDPLCIPIAASGYAMLEP